MKIKPIPKRYLFVMFAFYIYLLLYIDRVCISAAKEPIALSLGFSDRQMGWVLSIFAIGYALFQTPSGLLVDRYGPKKVLTSIIALWSLYTGLTVTSFNYISMLIIRFIFGVSEAGALPSVTRAVFSWIPMPDRALVHGINLSGARLGAAFALPAVAWMIDKFSWHISFLILTFIGIVSSLAWYFWFHDEPTEHPKITEHELKYILENRQKPDRSEKDNQVFSLKHLFISRNMWFVMIQYFCSNYTFFFCLTWLYPHLNQIIILKR